MRILFLTPFLPDQGAHHGGGSYIGALAAGLRDRAELGLAYLGRPGDGAPDAATWSWSASVPYEGDPSGLGHRLKMLARWRGLPLLAAKHGSAAMRALLARARQEFYPDVALVEMAQMAHFLPELRGIPTVLTDHEAGQPANAGTGLGAWADRRDAALWSRYLRSYFPLADRLQAVTEEDAASLRGALGRSVEVRPAALLAPQGACDPGAAPPTALFVGDYRHRPNPEAARRLADEVWPKIRDRCPEAQLLLAGPHPEPVQDLSRVEGVQVLGFVEDLTGLMGSARLMLGPTWSGGGFRVKNATALLHGLPVVTNALGARGCAAGAPACTIAETPDALAAATCALLQDPARARAAGDAARQWALAQFSPSAVATRQLEALRSLAPGASA